MDKKVGVAVGLAAVAVGAVILLAKGPTEYSCPYCSEVFATYEELVAHIQSAHAGQRIPIDIIWS